MVIVAPDIGETAIKKRLEALKKSIADFGGEVSFEDLWGLRDLAYSIRKHDQGFYAVMDVNLDPEKIKELDRMLRLEREILRHLLLKVPAVYQPKTLNEMEAEAAAEEKEREMKKEEKKPVRPVYVKKVETVKEEVKEEKPAKVEKKKETKEEASEEPVKKAPKKKEESKKALEDIDAKLDSILSNPDINF
jgi:small subunit ribosomal protein S6